MFLKGQTKRRGTCVKVFHIFVAALLTLGACATPMRSYMPQPLAGTDALWLKGSPGVASATEQSTAGVFFPAASEMGQRLRVMVVVSNVGQQTITVGPENIFASLEDGRAVEIVSAERLRKEAQADAAWRRFGAALSSAGEAMSASNAGNVSASGTIVTPRGGLATYTMQGYDPAARQAAQTAADRNLERRQQDVAAFEANRLAEARAGAFPRQTLFPGDMKAGFVTLGKIPPGPQTLILRVVIGSDTHLLRFTASGPA
jgi:hypothetical protein